MVFHDVSHQAVHAYARLIQHKLPANSTANSIVLTKSNHELRQHLSLSFFLSLFGYWMLFFLVYLQFMKLKLQ